VLAQEEGTPVDSTVSCDAESKICYSGYTDPEAKIYFGIALPKNPVDPYDAIIKITSPVEHYWTGFSWGGNMVWNPLTVAWRNGQTTTASARFALYVRPIHLLEPATNKPQWHHNAWAI
jgi:hypothetical protein